MIYEMSVDEFEASVDDLQYVGRQIWSIGRRFTKVQSVGRRFTIYRSKFLKHRSTTYNMSVDKSEASVDDLRNVGRRFLTDPPTHVFNIINDASSPQPFKVSVKGKLEF
jgi:hypothetical protein